MAGMESSGALFARDDAPLSPAETVLKLLQDPFASTIVASSIWASLGTSIGFTILIAITFSFLRPYNSVVYAPKLKHADDKHAPPPMGKGIFAWFSPLVKTKEADLIHIIGMDATLFLRFTRMLRNMFILVAILGCCILIPINLTLSVKGLRASSIIQMTPINTWGSPNWGIVICAWLFQVIIIGLLWWNYRKVLALRRQYYDSPEYQGSLHARTLMVNDIPRSLRSDEGIGRLIDEIAPTSSFSRSAIGRNVKDLPELIKEHDQTVRSLEKHLANYLKNPDQLPASRPTCKPSKQDPSYGSFPRGQKVDAIEYLTDRIRSLELEIKEVRLSVDKRNALPYGFASYEDISEAHSIAFDARNKHPQGTTIVLAPRPNDVIWDNMPLTKKTRKWRGVVNNLWITLLTIVWVAPNIGISIFLVTLSNLGRVWPAFQRSLSAHTSWWAIVQGVASPGLMSLIYLILPIIFRRLAIRAGDRSKTARERHVTAKLYTFFVFNNLIVFTFFSVIWTFITLVINLTSGPEHKGAWDAIKEADLSTLILNAICNLSPFWVTWLLQRNLGAAVDLAQLWTLIWSFCARKFSSPTPREMIELTAPPPFDYASYYNYFLFYATVTLCYATVQPLVLPAAALYFAIDVYLKKYLLLYIFITKTESGGMFWRIVFNRMVFATILSNLVVFFVLFVRGDGFHVMSYAVVPLPFIMIGFKLYCRKAFDDKIHYYKTTSAMKDPEAHLKSRFTKSDRLASRYGHPALYKPLITPMVHARAQNILASIYAGRLSDPNNAGSGDVTSVSGYSDTYALDPMRADKPGRAVSGKQQIPGFEVVPENKLDFSYFKNRAEFGDDHGQGTIYSHPTDIIDRPGTSNTFRTGYGSEGSSRAASPAPGIHRKEVSGMSSDGSGNPYSTPYSPTQDQGEITSNRFYQHRNDSGNLPLVHGAADMPVMSPGGHRTQSPAPRAPGFLGGGPQGYGGLPQHEEEPVPDPASYDYFRASRRQNQNQGW